MPIFLFLDIVKWLMCSLFYQFLVFCFIILFLFLFQFVLITVVSWRMQEGWGVKISLYFYAVMPVEVSCINIIVLFSVLLHVIRCCNFFTIFLSELRTSPYVVFNGKHITFKKSKLLCFSMKATSYIYAHTLPFSVIVSFSLLQSQSINHCINIQCFAFRNEYLNTLLVPLVKGFHCVIQKWLRITI